MKKSNPAVDFCRAGCYTTPLDREGSNLMDRFEGKRRFSAGISLFAAAALLSACQSDNGLTGVDTTAPPPPKEQITQSELEAFCPSVNVRDGTASFSTYTAGKSDDSSQVIYQASIADATRACKRADGQMSIDVAVAGRIVPGPQGKPGSITLPIRVVVSSSGQVVYSQLHQYKVAVNDTASATQFLFRDPAIVIPQPPRGQARVFVGFDEGPSKAASE